jgi:hypothetical protein
MPRLFRNFSLIPSMSEALRLRGIKRLTVSRMEVIEPTNPQGSKATWTPLRVTSWASSGLVAQESDSFWVLAKALTSTGRARL